MKLILLAISCLVCIYSANACCDESLMDLVFVVDASVDAVNFNFLKEALKNIVSNLNVNPNKFNVALITYSAIVEKVRSFIDTDQSKYDLLNYINGLTNKNGNSALSDAITEAKKMFDLFTRPSSSKIVVALTRGVTSSNVYAAVDSLKRKNVRVFTVAVGSSIDDNILTYIASEPKSHFKKSVSNFDELISSINEITDEACKTNAIVVNDQYTNINLGQKIRVQAVQYQVKNFVLDTRNFNSPTVLQLEITNIQGDNTLFSYSFTYPNSPTSSSAEEKIEKIGYETSYYFVTVPLSTRYFYFSIKSYKNINEYDIQVNKYVPA